MVTMLDVFKSEDISYSKLWEVCVTWIFMIQDKIKVMGQGEEDVWRQTDSACEFGCRPSCSLSFTEIPAQICVVPDQFRNH